MSGGLGSKPFDGEGLATNRKNLVEKGELTSGSTWHAAGQCPHFNSSLNMTRVHIERDYIVTVAQDLSERKRGEELQREYERVVEGLSEIILVVDRRYRYVLVNQAYLDY